MIGYLKLYPCVQVHARGKFYYNPQAFLVHITQKNPVRNRARYRYLTPDLPVSCSFLSFLPFARIFARTACRSCSDKRFLHIRFPKAEVRSLAKPQTFVSAECTLPEFCSALLFVQNANYSGLFPGPHAFFSIHRRSSAFQAAVSPHLSDQLTRAFFQYYWYRDSNEEKRPLTALPDDQAG